MKPGRTSSGVPFYPYKGVLYSKELFYVVFITAGFFVICVISDVVHAYTHSCSPYHVFSTRGNNVTHLYYEDKLYAIA